MDPNALRNFKDFLQMYNKMTEICSLKCIDNFNSRQLDQDEIDCVERCSSKLVKFNNRLMQSFVTAQTIIVNRRVAETEAQMQQQQQQINNEQQQQLIGNTQEIENHNVASISDDLKSEQIRVVS